MEKFTSVHPLISKIDKKGTNSYPVHETLKFGFIPFSFTYPVIIEALTKENIVIFWATVFKLTKVEIKFTLETDGEHTLVNEQIQFKMPLPIKSILKNTFRKHHTQLFKNIEAK